MFVFWQIRLFKYLMLKFCQDSFHYPKLVNYHLNPPILLECIFDYINRNQKNEKKEHTALHIAVEKEDIQIIKALLKNKNIDIEATDELGNKPINLTNNQEVKDLLK